MKQNMRDAAFASRRGDVIAASIQRKYRV